MKVALLPVLLILAGAFALPPQNAENRDVVTESIRDIIQRIAEFFLNSGLDPIKVQKLSFEYQGNLIQIDASLEDLAFSGASNIVINRLYNNVLLGTFDFDVVLPELSLSIGNAALEASLGESSVAGEIKGSLSIRDIRLAGQVRYRGSIIIGVEIVGIALQNELGGIEADVSLVINDNDLSERVNTFLNNTLPNTLANFRNEINALLAQAIMAIIRRLSF